MVGATGMQATVNGWGGPQQGFQSSTGGGLMSMLGGLDPSGTMAMFTGGMQVGSGIGGLINGMRQARQAGRDQRQAFNTSLGALQNLLGTGFNLEAKQQVMDPSVMLDPEWQARMGVRSDQVVDPFSTEAQWLAPGTVVARRQGDKGMDPRIAAARAALFGTLNRGGAIREEQAGNMQAGAAQQAGAAMQTQPTTNLQQAMGQLQSLGGAGQASAQTAIQVGQANTEFRRAARTQALQSLGQLYSTAGAVF